MSAKPPMKCMLKAQTLLVLSLELIRELTLELHGVGAHVALEFTKTKALMDQFHLYELCLRIPLVPIFILNSVCTRLFSLPKILACEEASFLR